LPMMQEMGTLVGETLVPYIEKIFLAFGALGKIIWGLGEYIVSFGTDNSTLEEGWAEMGAIFSTEIAKDVEAVHAVATVVDKMDKNVVSQLKTGWGDLPKIRDAVKPDLTSMNKFASSELIKMMGLLGDKTNVAGVGAANTAVNVGAARGDVTTLKEMKDLWYKTLMSEGGWTKSDFNKSSNVNSASDSFNQMKNQSIEINITGMNGNYTTSEKREFEDRVVEVIEKERAKRPR